MHKVASAGHLANEFTNGNPATQVPSTTLEEAWHNTVQRELVKVVQSMGITLDILNDIQVWEALNLLNQGRCTYKLTRVSNTQFKLEANKIGIDNFVLVNNERVNITTAKTNDVSGGGVDNTIDGAGADTASVPLLSTEYHIYLSNSVATPFPSSVALSSVAPTNGYLASSGNGANWRHMGYLRLDGSIEIADNWQIQDYRSIQQFQQIMQTVSRSSGASQYFPWDAINDVVMMPGTNIVARLVGLGEWNIANTLLNVRLKIETTTNQFGQAFTGNAASTKVTAIAEEISPEAVTFKGINLEAEYFYGGANQIDLDNTSQLIFTRIFNPAF